MNAICKKSVAYTLIFSLVIVMSFSFSLSNVNAATTSKSSYKTKVLQQYVLCGDYSSKKLVYTPVKKKAEVYIWNKKTNKFQKAKKSKKNIFGNYIQLIDNNGNKTADIIKVVKRKDASSKWNKNMIWKNGAGTKTEPYLSDATAKTVYGKEYRIPFGERQLSGYGITDYCGTNDFSNVANSKYWPTYDYYNMKSGNGLTMLEGYKSQSQSTGWACVMTSTVTVLNWYNKRGDLNEEDLASLRGSTKKSLSGGTSLNELESVYKHLNKLKIGSWKYVDSNTKGYQDKLYDSAWIQSQLKQGHPITVIWDSFGAHAQVIIGYDNMNTENTADDQLIMMDPYDTTDQNADGYVIQSYERLEYGTLNWNNEVTGTKFMVAYPSSGWSYKPSTTGGISNNASNTIVNNDTNKLNSILYGKTATDIQKYYKDDVELGPHFNLGGAAGYERDFDYDHSPFYNFYDYYNYKNGTSTEPTNTLKMIENFKTEQQATEWTCGCTSAMMVMEHFGMNSNGTNPLESEITLSYNRQNGEPGATYLYGMKRMFNYMNKMHDQQWTYLTKNDLTDPNSDWSTIKGTSGKEYSLQGGSSDNGLIPYFINNGIPVMVGSDEWGGHWQVIVGYDDMRTARTQDDVIILADPYDTTDQNDDGYFVKGFERLVYGWDSSYEASDTGQENDMIIAFPITSKTQSIADEFGLKVK